MAAVSKWISQTRPDQPVGEAARRAVALRLAQVDRLLPPAAQHADQEIEHVHQLRVATRRARAALDLFADLLPPRRRRQMIKWLRRIRRAAGDARDLDVLIERWSRHVKKGAPAGLGQVLARLKEERLQRQEPLQATEQRLRERNFTRRIEQLVERIRWRGTGPEPQLRAHGSRTLRRLLDDFLAVVDDRPETAAELHALRIAGKRLRYALEIYAGAFGSGLRRHLYPEVEELQELLGDANDRATALARIAHWADTPLPRAAAAALRILRSEEERALATAQRTFQRRWTPARFTQLQRDAEHVLGPPAG